jgi:hypothetical protein
VPQQAAALFRQWKLLNELAERSDGALVTQLRR